MILLKNRDRNPSFKSGKYVEINDAGNYPMELSVDGVCKQETTTGRNLLPSGVSTSITKSGVTFSCDGNGNYTLKGTNSDTKNVDLYINLVIPMTLPTDKNLYLHMRNNVATGDSGMLFAYQGSNFYVPNFNDVNRITTSTKLNCGEPLNIIGATVQAGKTVSITFTPSIELTPNVPDFEPYTGGHPSPSPDYPQPIEVITEDFDLVSCGKNEFNYTNASPNSGITPILNEDGSITCKGVQEQEYFSITKYINNDIPKGTHILSIDKIVDTNIIIRFLKADGSNKEYTIYIGQKNVTFESKDEYLGYYIYSYLRGSVGKKVDLTIKLQIEKGDKASEFEPYQETRVRINLPDGEFIGKINDTYKDTLNVVYKDDGYYHLILNKMVGKLVLNGSETITKSGATTNEILVATLNVNGFVDGRGISNYFVYSPYVEKNKFGIYNNGKNLRFCLDIQQYATIDDFKSWLSTHNTEVYYALATPYEVDLGIVDTLLSYDKITNIFSDSDLLPVINVKYYKDFEFDKILRSGYNIDEQEYEIAKKQMANGKRKRILSSYDDCIIKINLGLLDNKTYQEYKEQLDDGEFHYWSYKYNQYKKANFILTKPSITTEYAYDDDIGIDDMEITLEKSSDIE